MLYTTNNKEQTIQIGKKIAPSLQGGDVVLLSGDLGAGKTTLTKGIAEYFGIKEDVLSPTFTLMNVHEVKSQKSKVKSLVHIDTYRLENEEQLTEIGVQDYLGESDTICLIEWPEKIINLLKNKKTIKIDIEHLDENSRKISFSSVMP